MTVYKVVYCKCGNKARAGQRTCRSCHNLASQKHRAKLRRIAAQTQRILENLTTRNSETEAAFSATFKTNAVVIRGLNDDPDISGFVIGFLPDKMLKVMDDDGRTHIVTLERVQEDLGRTLYGRRNQTQLHTSNAEGNQGGAPSLLLGAVSKTGSGRDTENASSRQPR